ncbi:MAG: cysteine synthase A [Acholeplasmatales bacterium]|nr:cysteine synthase A [Acholeplasmatales bacterium]MBQ7641056.1 cysteine synthase A [Acholeplasmatales bacterium]
MAKYYESVLDLIGHTPIVKLNRLKKVLGLKANIFAKLEFLNPGGSVKDRPALNMILEAEKEGLVKEGTTIIEGTSGNTGIGLAMVGAARGYSVKICMPENMSIERVKLLKAYGAEVYLTPKELSMAGGGSKAQELAEGIPNSFTPKQGMNPNNPGAHYKTTGPEIWDDMDGNIDIFLAATGTGGTISGVGHYLREKKSDLPIIAVEPKGSAVLNGGTHGPHKIQGIGGGATPPTTDVSLFNEVIDISDEDAYEYTKLLPKVEGILIGISAGAALAGAVEVAKREENKDKNIVIIFPDGGDHYLSTPELFEV